jgi:NAD-dependent dihydropyrimidine dehydrogenase PreA subunit
MSFPDILYMPTGIFAGPQPNSEFIQVSGFCFRRVEDNISLPAGNSQTNTSYITGFDDCVDCNSCECPVNFDLKFIGAYQTGVKFTISGAGYPTESKDSRSGMNGDYLQQPGLVHGRNWYRNSNKWTQTGSYDYIIHWNIRNSYPTWVLTNEAGSNGTGGNYLAYYIHGSLNPGDMPNNPWETTGSAFGATGNWWALFPNAKARPITGFGYGAGGSTYGEKTFNINLSSTGWVELAIPSGYLNGGTDLNPSGSGNFIATDIQTTYRKIDMNSGIDVSFNSSDERISRFSYDCSRDKFGRENLQGKLISGFLTGTHGATPVGTYLNLFDSGNSPTNKIETIKFYHNCDIDCNKEDIWFRMRGHLKEGSYRKYGSTSDWSPYSWIYLQCKDVPQTPGQIVNCIPQNTGVQNGYGLSLNNYFESGDFKAGHFPHIQFMPSTIDVVNMDMLTGSAGSGITKRYSISGGHHFGTPDGGYGYYHSVYDAGYYGYPKGYDFYHISPDNDSDGYSDRWTGSQRYLSGVGRFGYKYHFPKHESGFVNSRDATDRGLLPPAPETPDYFQWKFGQEFYSKALTPSEYADGLFKNGTYRPMWFTGTVTGRLAHWESFFGNTYNAEKRENWQTGAYVFQYFESGDAHRPNKIQGNFGILDANTPIDHYRSLVDNHSPINMGNKLEIYSSRSGNFPDSNATLEKASIVLNMGNPNLGNTPSDQGYQLPFKFEDQTKFTFNYDNLGLDDTFGNLGVEPNPFDDYEMNGVIVSGDSPWFVHKTLIPYSTGDGARLNNLLINSGNLAHSEGITDPSATKNTLFERIDGIKFVLRFK